jgi:hypothetical protein
MRNQSFSMIRKTAFLTSISALGFLSMGNQSCEQAPAARVLKMEIDVGNVEARVIRLPNGEVVDFPFIANSLFYRQVMNQGHFNIANNIPTVPGTAPGAKALTAASSQAGKLRAQRFDILGTSASNYSLSDEQILARFGLKRPAPTSDSSLNLTSPGSVSAKATGAADDVSCLLDAPQAVVKGEVVSFAATWGVGVGVGYGRGGIALPIGNVSGSVDFSQSELELGLRADDPLTGRTDVISEGISQKSDIKLAVDFSAGLPIGLNFFYKDTIASVIRAAYDKALAQMVKDFARIKGSDLPNEDGWNQSWSSKVINDPALANNDTHVAFRGGLRSGIKAGDEFAIYPMRYSWKGAACQSKLDYQIPSSTTPTVTVRVIAVGDMVTVGQVVKSQTSSAIRPGDQVKLVRFAPLAAAAAVKSIR